MKVDKGPTGAVKVDKGPTGGVIHEKGPTVGTIADKPKRVRRPTKTGPKLRGEDVVSPIAVLFRRKIQDIGLSIADVARVSGIDYSVVFRFMKGERDLNSLSYHQLMEMFGGRIVFDD